ncbi:major facilitator superfamily domain-containing protein [Ilyonectria destructans]|nr:major facilitator superfamily domain-containing protein [Ilyonectria destructans]
MASSDNSETTPPQKELTGVPRMEALNNELTFPERCCLFVSIFLVSYAYVMDAVTRSTYQGYATSSYSQHSLLSTINVIRGVIAAVIQPLVAKLSDLIGRMELFLIVAVFYIVGTIIEASTTNVQGFAVGALLYQIGYISTTSIFEIIIAAFTSMRSRVFFMLIPNMPYIINTWVGGQVAAAVLSATAWQWGIGMWCIIYPFCTIPFITIMLLVGRRAAKKQPPKTKSQLGSLIDLFWQLDIVGIFLLTAVLSLTLIPLTLAGGEDKKWKTAGILAPVILGILLTPLFVVWETKTAHPMMPSYLIRERGMWAAMGLSTFIKFSWYTQSDFLYTVLYISFDFSVTAATRVASVYSFCAVVGGASLGLVIVKVRRLQRFILGRLALWLVAYGILIHFRGGTGTGSQAGITAGQVLLGLAGGFFPYPNLEAAQTLAKHGDLAVVTSLILAMNNVGMALGGCVSGAIWTQTLYDRLQKDLAPNAELAAAVYASPLYVVPEYPVGTNERAEIIESYRYIQRPLTITGICVTVPMITFAMCLRNTKLAKHKHTLAE